MGLKCFSISFQKNVFHFYNSPMVFLHRVILFDGLQGGSSVNFMKEKAQYGVTFVRGV